MADAPKLRCRDLVEELNSPPIDLARVIRSYPELEGHDDIDFYEVEELAGSRIAALEFAIPRVVVEIDYANGDAVTFSNRELIDWIGPRCEGYSLLIDSRFAYFIISKAAYQAGSVGIWDLTKREWHFQGSEDELCAESILYIPAKDRFVGFVEYYYPLTGPSGSWFFVIKDREARYGLSFQEAHVEKLPPSDVLIKQRLWSHDGFFAAEETGSFVYKAIAGSAIKRYEIPADLREP